MPVDALVTTAGAANANAYCDLAFADQYHLNRPAVGTTWSAASTDQKTAAILWGTLLMDRMWCWSGWVTLITQVRMWPRQGMILPTLVSYVDNMTIPVELKQATAEYARQLIASDLAGDSQIENLKLTSLRAGPVAFTFGEGVTAKPVPDTVFNLIPPMWGYVRSRNPGYRQTARA
jgi:hypothetical protein